MTIDFLFDAYNAASWLLWIFRIPVRWKGANILALKPLFSHETRLICVFDLLPEINGHFVFLRFENGKKVQKGNRQNSAIPQINRAYCRSHCK